MSDANILMSTNSNSAAQRDQLPKITENEEIECTAFQKYTSEMEANEAVRKEIMLGKRVGLYRLKGNLGNGNFSQVKLAIHLLTREEVAVKILDKTKLDAKTQRLLSREISSMERLHHPNVIRLYEVIEDFHKMHIVMEYASGGELHSMIVNQGKIPEPIAKLIFAQVVAAIDHLHCQKVIHRDLKAENVFFAGDKLSSHISTENGRSASNISNTSNSSRNSSGSNNQSDNSKQKLSASSNQNENNSNKKGGDTGSRSGSLSRLFHVKLGDFGFSTVAEPTERLTTFCGSPPYAAPELFQAEWYHGPWVDIWALGVLLYFMLCGCMPFRGESVSVLKKLIVAGNYNCPSWMPSVAKQLIQNLLKLQPPSRLSIIQIKSHPWMEGQVFANAYDAFKPTPSVPDIETVSEDTEANNDDNENKNDEAEAAKMMLRLGITDKHIEVAQAQAVRNYVTGTYRIMLHRVHKSRRMSHIPHSISNPELGHKYLNTRRNKHHLTAMSRSDNCNSSGTGSSNRSRQRSKVSTQSEKNPKNFSTDRFSKICSII